MTIGVFELNFVRLPGILSKSEANSLHFQPDWTLGAFLWETPGVKYNLFCTEIQGFVTRVGLQESNSSSEALLVNTIVRSLKISFLIVQISTSMKAKPWWRTAHFLTNLVHTGEYQHISQEIPGKLNTRYLKKIHPEFLSHSQMVCQSSHWPSLVPQISCMQTCDPKSMSSICDLVPGTWSICA